MKKIIAEMKNHLRILNSSIYTGVRFEKNLTALIFLGVVMIVFGTLMAVLNAIQGKIHIACICGLFTLNGIFTIVSAAAFKRREPPCISTFFVSAIVFSFFAIDGSNGGFSILWTFLVPIAFSYFMSVKYGIMLSVVFDVLFMIMFWTPLRELFSTIYNESFMIRFPLLYLSEVVITGIAMSQYHERSLLEVNYTERLNEEVERQSNIAKARASKLERLSDEMILALARAIDAKDKYTNGHSFRVSDYSVALAKKLGWDDEATAELKREALLHDVGKIGVPDAILNKPGRLTEEEYEKIKAHTTIGGEILQGLEDMEDIAEVILYHHERFDGKGYPKGIAGKSIPERARIVAIADAYDAMNSDRIYRPALSKDKIIEEFQKGSGKQFDPDLVPFFLELIKNGEIS